MKKIILVFCFIIFDLNVLANEKDNFDLILKKLKSIEKRIETIEKKLENPLGFLLNENFSSKISSEFKNKTNDVKNLLTSKRKVKKDPKISDYLKLISWNSSRSYESSSFEKKINLSYTLENISNETILLIDGSLIFFDKLQEKLGTFNLTKDFKMIPGETKQQEGTYALNLLTDEKIFRITTMDKKLIIPKLKIKQILLGNNKIIKFN